jgi:hypothetical protein
MRRPVPPGRDRHERQAGQPPLEEHFPILDRAVELARSIGWRTNADIHRVIDSDGTNESEGVGRETEPSEEWR